MDKQWRREKRNFYDAWQKGLVTGGGSGTWDGFVSAGEPAAMNGFWGMLKPIQLSCLEAQLHYDWYLFSFCTCFCFSVCSLETRQCGGQDWYLGGDVYRPMWYFHVDHENNQ